MFMDALRHIARRFIPKADEARSFLRESAARHALAGLFSGAAILFASHGHLTVDLDPCSALFLP